MQWKNSNRKNNKDAMQQKEIEEADNNTFGILIKNFVKGADGSEFLRIPKEF